MFRVSAGRVVLIFAKFMPSGSGSLENHTESKPFRNSQIQSNDTFLMSDISDGLSPLPIFLLILRVKTPSHSLTPATLRNQIIHLTQRHL
jgi:hypothetical protein